MKTLDASFTLLHALELGTGYSSDLRAGGAHVVGQHHDVVDTDHVQCKLTARRVITPYRGDVAVHYWQPRNVRHTVGTTNERQMLQAGRQRLVDAQRYVTE